MNSKQQTLRKLMSIVDEYKDTIKEGDYLQLCTLLRDMWNNSSSQQIPDNPALRRLRVHRYHQMYQQMRMLQKYRVSADFPVSQTIYTDNEINRLASALLRLQPYICNRL